MKFKVCIMNMTARSGKDVAAQHMLKLYGEDKVKVLSFKEMLITATAKVLGITEEDFLKNYDAKTENVNGINDSPYGEWFKDYPIYTLGYKMYSKRTALIHVSEEVLKPMFGKGVFGKALSEKLDADKLNIISDGGFIDEVYPFMQTSDILILRRDRMGTNWAGDSRGWLNASEVNGKQHYYVETPLEGDQELEHYLGWVETMIFTHFQPQN